MLSEGYGRRVELEGLNINMFGEFRVWRGEDLIERKEWGSQKTRPLLKLLLTRPGHAFSRDEIIEALWPGVSPEAGERSLRAAVSQLRRVLEPDLERGSGSHYILSQSPGYSFDESSGAWIDTREFEKHLDRAEAARQDERLVEAVNEYQEALELVQGEFLEEDPYEEWAISARDHWREQRLAALSALAECHALRGHYTEAIEICDRALALDRHRDDLYRQLMLYHYCAGEQALALQAYRRYARMLEEELDTVPPPELTRLKEKIEVRDVPGVDSLRRYPKPRRPLRLPYALSRTHFVGRDAEYARLAERLTEAMEGSGSAVVVEGEAGVGKTRLVEEFLGYARSQGARVLSGRCYEIELGPPLEPVMDALNPVTDQEDLVTGFPQPEPGLSPEAEMYNTARLYQTLTRELVRESRGTGHKGLVFFVDDLQWADPATLDFLSYLARRASRERILLVVTYRREDVTDLSGWLDGLGEHRAITTLSLKRLSIEDTTRLLGHMSSRTFAGLPHLAAFLQRESEGNPFYAVEYLRWLIEAGIVEIDTRRQISGLKDTLPLEGALPSSLRSLVQARLTGLGDQARELLKLAAVIGRNFDLRLLCTAAACEELEALDVIEPLVASGLVVENGEGAYHFSHEKLRQALYEGISAPRRRALHLQVAKVLEQSAGDPAELAHHYLRAQEWEQALEKLMQTAQRAKESWAWENALKSYTRALEILEQLPDSDERRFELLEAQEQLLEHVDRRIERAAMVQEMFELANRLGGRTRIAEVHIRRIGVLADLSNTGGAEEAYREAVNIFRELGDTAGEARAHREMGYIYWLQRDYARSLESNFQAFRAHHAIGDRMGQAGDVSNLVECYIHLRDYQQALEWAERAMEDYGDLEGYEGIIGEVVRLDTLVTSHRERGDLETALSASLELVRIWTERGDKTWIVTDSNNSAMLYLALGDAERALEHFRTAARISREMGHARDEGNSLLGVGMALEQAGDPSGAADAYRRSVELLETAHEVSRMPEELSAKAEALTLLANVLDRYLDEPEEALEAYEGAAESYRDLDDADHLRKVSLSIAGLRWRVGDLEGSARGYEEVLESVRDEPADRAAALAGLGVIYRDLGRLKESLACGREALRLLRDLDDPRAESYVLTSLAETHSRLGQHPSARSCLRQSIKLRQKTGDEEGEVSALRSLAKTYIDLGDIDHAQASLEEAGRKGEALVARSTSTAVSTGPVPSQIVSVGEVEKVGIADLRSGQAENRAENLRLLRSYITDQRGRKFYYEYAAPSMETVIEDSRRAGLSPVPDAVTQVLAAGMFS